MKRHTVREYLDILFSKNLVKSFILSAELMEKEVCDLTFSSKDQCPGGIFICKGAAFKKEYLESAVRNGALLYVSEVAYSVRIPAIIVNDIRSAMPYLADVYFDGAINSMNSVGITGTKGKTTTSFMIKSAIDLYMAEQGRTECALISSVRTFDGTNSRNSLMTTPEAVEYQRIFAKARDNGCGYIVSEVSSQGLKYQRCTLARYKAAVFTNISPDHISPNEHSDFEDYFSSKLKIFEMCENAFIFSGSDRFEEIYNHACCRCKNVFTFGYNDGDDYKAENITQCEGGNKFFVNGREYFSPMPGRFNVNNALAAIAVCDILAVPYEYIKSGIRDVTVDGRCEIFESSDKRICAIVDYAHNKESMNELIKLAREHYPDRKICLVFGCPGEKAYNRRKELGSLACECDYAIITEDDPAKESLADICNEVLSYAEKGRAECSIIYERPEAIRTAIEKYSDDTVILIAGKGSEKTQKRANGAEPYPSDSYYAAHFIKAYEEECNKIKK